MSLQVWLPLNGDLHNQGLSKISVTNNGATINDNGKIGKCYSFDGSDDFISLNSQKLYDIFQGGTQQFSIAFWVYHADATRAIIFGDYGLTGSISFNIELTTSHAVRFYWAGSPDKNFNSTSYVAASAWTHICLTYDGSKVQIYRNGILSTDIYNGTLAVKNKTSGMFYLGRDSRTGTTALNGKLNDFRIYDHCLSSKEVKEIAKGLILHYKLDDNVLGNPNLFKGTIMRPIDRTNFVSNSSTDWTKYLRYYNGNASIHTFTEEDGIYIDTVKLNSAANLGICFGRLASEINLDSSSYYTISCEAKCTKAGAGIDIGLSYLTTSDSWVWRGGSNRKLFNNTTDWQFFTHTFKPDSNTKAINYCFTVLGVSNGTDTLSIRKCKLEKGFVATSWFPAPEDMGINENTIYDSSGYNYNGTIVGDLTTNINSSRYSYSTIFNGTSRIVANSLPAETKTLTCWAKTTKNKSTSQQIVADSNSALTISFYQGTIIGVFGTTRSTGSKSTLGSEYKENDWNFFAVVKMSDDGKRDIYCNGVKLTPTSNDYWGAATGFFIGARNASQGNPFYGEISDVRAYATALTADQILELYNTSATIDNKGNIYARELVEI